MTGMEKLGSLLTAEVQKTISANQNPVLEFGSITDDRLTLFPDSLRKSITFDSYTVLNHQYLENGDRVLLAWVGQEPVVLGTIGDE